MPRHPRLFIPGATYHVYCRVARGEFVFNDDHEAIEFVETIREVRDLDGWSVLAWYLMGNHYHLVVKTRNVEWVPPLAPLHRTFAPLPLGSWNLARMIGRWTVIPSMCAEGNPHP